MSLQLQNQPPPPRAGLLPRGCWIALIITGALAVILVAVAAVAVYAISQHPDVQRVARVVGGAMHVMGEAAAAPGTGELRAMGCDRAMVFDTSRLAELARELEDDELQRGADPEVRLVVCQRVSVDAVPECDAVAQRYVQAVPTQPGPFTVMVQSVQEQQTRCMSRYAADGQLMLRLDTNSSPNLPMAPVGQ
jgi:hypothetical protein